MRPAHFFSPARRHRGKLIVLLSVAALAVMAVMGYLIWSGYQGAIRAAETTTRNYAAIIEARLDATLRRADADLQALARTIPPAALSKQALPRYARELDAELDFRVFNFKEMTGYRVADVDGDTLYTSASASTPRVNVSDRSYFRALRDNPQANLVFSEVVIGRSTGRHVVAIAKTLKDGRGNFMGIVYGLLELEHFQKLFQSLDIGAQGVLTIYRSDDFRLVVRSPLDDGKINTPLPPENPVRAALARGNKAVTNEFSASTDGVVRLYSSHALDRHPFFVAAALTRDDVLAGWRIRALAVGLSGLLLLGLMASLFYRLVRAEARQAHAVTGLAESEANLRAISDNASIGILVLLDGRYVFANRHAAQMLGYTVEELEQIPVADTIHPDYRALLFERHRRRLAGEDAPSRYEAMALAKDGSAIPVELNAAVIRWNGQTADMVFISDITVRKKAEAALRTSAEKYRSIYENMQDVYVESSVEGTIVEISPQIEELTKGQYRREDYIGKPAATFYADPDRRADFLRALKEQGSVRDFETEILSRDGSWISCSISARLIVDQRGQPQRLVATVRDITERKQVENALKLLSTGMVHLSGEAFFNEIARQAARLLGVEIGFVGLLLNTERPGIRTLGLSIDGQFMAPVEYELARTPCEAVIGRKTAIFAQDIQRLFPEDRMLVDLGVSGYAAVPLFNMEGDALGHVGVMSREPLDHPERVEAMLRLFAVRCGAEIERQREHSRFQDLFEFSPDGVIMVNQKGLITLANRKAESLFGYTRDELIGVPVDNLIPQADKAGHAAARQQYFANPMPRSMGSRNTALHARRKDGTTFPTDISLSPMQSDEGTLVVAAVRDVSARVQAEEQRKALETQLRQSHKMEAIGTLAGGIAHDFNNVISAIIGNVELAREDVGADHPAIESLDEIGKASRRARDLVSQILAFSRQQPHPRQAISLASLVEEVVKLLRATLPAGIELGTTLAVDAPSVLADPTQIHQILMNLCTNAWHAMDAGRGRIDIQLNTAVLGQNAVRTHADLQPGRFARLSVKDSGKGMDAATLERIFEPFFTTKAVGEGTGLGLSVVHGIMRGYQGAITVNSQVGSGTTFHLYFPATDAAAGTAASEKAPAAAPLRGRGQHVLYLDDDDSLVLLVTRMLERSGYRVSGYTESAYALQAVRADPGRFDLVVTDYNMPGMSGLDMAREVARIRPDLPVVVTSGYITDELREKAPQAGVRQLVYKPNSAEELCETVRNLMDEGS